MAGRVRLTRRSRWLELVGGDVLQRIDVDPVLERRDVALAPQRSRSAWRSGRPRHHRRRRPSRRGSPPGQQHQQRQQAPVTHHNASTQTIAMAMFLPRRPLSGLTAQPARLGSPAWHPHIQPLLHHHKATASPSRSRGRGQPPAATAPATSSTVTVVVSWPPPWPSADLRRRRHDATWRTPRQPAAGSSSSHRRRRHSAGASGGAGSPRNSRQSPSIIPTSAHCVTPLISTSSGSSRTQSSE